MDFTLYLTSSSFFASNKTTQIPQFILEEAPKTTKIIVAQPRRLAATGVAGRVANERGEEKPGTGSVGYVVRGDVAMCNSTRLMFCTTGVLLRQLQSEGALDCVSHIVIDEVHERHLDTDILLGILKASRPPHLRIVLMSATMDADRFAGFWGRDTPRM
jgi:HrpA-like RNA helicase